MQNQSSLSADMIDYEDHFTWEQWGRENFRQQ